LGKTYATLLATPLREIINLYLYLLISKLPIDVDDLALLKIYTISEISP
jgi:hypothetical protein